MDEDRAARLHWVTSLSIAIERKRNHEQRVTLQARLRRAEMLLDESNTRSEKDARTVDMFGAAIDHFDFHFWRKPLYNQGRPGKQCAANNHSLAMMLESWPEPAK